MYNLISGILLVLMYAQICENDYFLGFNRFRSLKVASHVLAFCVLTKHVKRQ